MGDDDEPVSPFLNADEMLRLQEEALRIRAEHEAMRTREREDSYRIMMETLASSPTNMYRTCATSYNTGGILYPKVKSIKICAYYTINTPYEKVIYDSFVKSPYFEGQNSNLVYFKGYENQGSWTANTALKPKFILETLQKFSNYDYFLFIDADSQVMREPVLLNDLMKKKVDLAFHRLDWQSWYRNGVERKELLSGTLLVRNYNEIKALCEEWYLQAHSTQMWEQKVLENILETNKYNLTISELPIEYCYIATMPDGSEPFVKVKEPVIVHHQASRKYRREINERQS